MVEVTRRQFLGMLAAAGGAVTLAGCSPSGASGSGSSQVGSNDSGKKQSVDSLKTDIAKIVADKGVTDATPGLALFVAKHGDMLYKQAYGLADLESARPITTDDNFIIASNTKQMACLAILMCADRGLVDLDAPVRKWFPDFPDYVEKINIRQMMGHTAGVPDYYEAGFADGFSDEMKALAQADTQGCLDFIKTLGDLDFEPDTDWSYSDSAYVMLGDIVRQATGTPFGAFLEQEVFQPLGMKQSFAPDDLNHRDKWLVNGYTPQENDKTKYDKAAYDMLQVGFADGCVSSNVDDMFTWHRWLFDDEGPELIPADLKKEFFVDRELKDGRKTGYGLGLFVGDKNSVCATGSWGILPHLDGYKEYFHSGGATGFGSDTGRFVDSGLSVVVLSNQENLDCGGILTDIAKLVLKA